MEVKVQLSLDSSNVQHEKLALRLVEPRIGTICTCNTLPKDSIPNLKHFMQKCIPINP